MIYKEYLGEYDKNKDWMVDGGYKNFTTGVSNTGALLEKEKGV